MTARRHFIIGAAALIASFAIKAAPSESPDFSAVAKRIEIKAKAMAPQYRLRLMGAQGADGVRVRNAWQSEMSTHMESLLAAKVITDFIVVTNLNEEGKSVADIAFSLPVPPQQPRKFYFMRLPI
jgi:hypothetical protein